jgi:acyl-CoA thioester hydrolase
MNYSFSHSTRLRVRYGETDQMGYCYYGIYAQYFEIGRVETMRSLGISYKKMEEEGIMLPVSEYQVRYKHPAYYDDQLTICTIIKEINGARIVFTYELINETGRLIATAETTLVFVNKINMRPIPAPENFLKLLLPHSYDS